MRAAILALIIISLMFIYQLDQAHWKVQEQGIIIRSQERIIEHYQTEVKKVNDHYDPSIKVRVKRFN